MAAWHVRFDPPLRPCVRLGVTGPAWLQDFQADVVTTRVAVPEGSTAVRVDPGRLSADVSEERTFTYLDTAIGRPTKVITTRRMTGDDTSAFVHVSYKFSPLFALLEPALLCAVFVFLFAAVLGCSRLDLTLVRGAAWRAQQVCPHRPPTLCAVCCAFACITTCCVPTRCAVRAARDTDCYA